MLRSRSYYLSLQPGKAVAQLYKEIEELECVMNEHIDRIDNIEDLVERLSSLVKDSCNRSRNANLQ